MKNRLIKISHPTLVAIKSVTTDGKASLKDGIIDEYSEESQSGIQSIIADFGEDAYINSIEIGEGSKGKEYFPENFRVEISDDGIVWEPLIQEIQFSQSGKKNLVWHFPLIKSRFLKIVSRKNNTVKGISLGKIKVFISGIIKINVSSEGDRLWVKENLIDGRSDYGWSSAISDHAKEEFALFDLGSISRVEEFRMLVRHDDGSFFPENFTAYYSEDDITWTQFLDEPRFFCQKGTWYKWRFLPVNMRFMKIVFHLENEPGRKKFGVQLAEIELYASSEITGNEKPSSVSYASVLRSGVVRLAADGESKEGLAIQSNDRRLRDATIEYKGIVELASDGEDKAGAAVQGNDKRLKSATEQTIGLVRLGANGEARPGLVVQTNDDRLKNATTSSFGIVELAENGETRPGVVVQGNDDRLKRATDQNAGLVILSKNGEDKPGHVVTADDKRLKKATTESEGIVKFSLSGATLPFTAVQANDKRISMATTENQGIVFFAKHMEIAGLKAVQSNDPRLEKASQDKPGIVEIAAHGSKIPGKVVLSDDPRLLDKRLPLPHTHDYAPINHDFSSHTGYIKLEGKVGNKVSGIVPPPKQDCIVYAKNEAEGSAIVGISRGAGITGYGEKNGIEGISPAAAGVFGASDKGYGGEFVSQGNFALSVGAESGNIRSSGKAVHANGISVFSGSLFVVGPEKQDCIARYFPVDPAEIIEPGDIVSINDEGVLVKTKIHYSSKIIGIAVRSAGLILGKKREKEILVAIAGIVSVNVDAADGSITFGDLLVSGITGGHAIRADITKIKAGTLLGKSLGILPSGRGKVPALIGSF